ncbi:MAG: hypothetical protein ACRDPG_00745 [Nocardioidaceae bacterium]
MPTEAIAQIPATHRKKLLVRSDGCRASHDLLDWLTEQGQVRGRRVEYSVGSAITEKIRHTIKLVPKQLWATAIDADGGIRDGGDVAELTGLLDLTKVASPNAGHRPPGMPSSGRATVAVRRGRRLALPGVRHKHHHRAAGVARSPTRPRPESRNGSGTPRTPV